MRFFNNLKNIFFTHFRMKAMITVGIGLLFFIAAPVVSATNYYVDANEGSDDNTGTQMVLQGASSGPWRTIGKVNRTTFSPGDSILFKRGGVWSDNALEPKNGGIAGGTFTMTETVLGQPFSFDLVDPKDHNCIYFGAYGTGNKPRIECRGGKGLILRHNYIIVEDLHLNDGGNAMVRLDRTGGNYWTILNNIEITECSGNALSFYNGGGNCWFNSLRLYNYEINGIYLRGSANNKLKGVLVENCWVENPTLYDEEDAISCHQDGDNHGIDGDIIIRNNTIIKSREDGIDITSGKNILVEGNIIRDCFNSGILVHYDRVSSVELRGNFLSSNVNAGGGGGELRLGASNIRVVNNIITGNGHNTVLFDNASNVQFWNNTIAPDESTGSFFVFINDGSHGIEFKNNIFDFSRTDQKIDRVSRSSLTFDHNCYVLKEAYQVVYDGSTFAHTRNADPSFEPVGFAVDPQFADRARSNPAHFKLQNTSPCIDAGTDLPVPLDYCGTRRPQGERIDIGSFEGVEDEAEDPGDDRGEYPREESVLEKWNGFPIPLNPFITIVDSAIEQDDKELLQIVDEGGEIIMEQVLNASKIDLPDRLNHLPAGKYLFILTDIEGKKSSYPVIKQ
jgi:hypothetical protein